MLLQKLKANSGHWIFKILFGLILVSFMLSGFFEYFVRQKAHSDVAKINGQPIRIDQFARKLQQVAMEISKSTNEPPSLKDLKDQGLFEEVLNGLISQELLAQESKHLKLTISDVILKDIILGLPIFQDKGHFNRALLNRFLQNMGMTENQFIQEIRTTLLSQQLLSPFITFKTFPQGYSDIFFDIMVSKRTYMLASIPVDTSTLKDKPSEQMLKAFYERHKDQFQRPEYRSIDLLWVSSKALEKNVSITSDKLRETYEQSISEFSTPEKRSFDIAFFPDESSALSAIVGLKKKKTLQTLAKELKGEFETYNNNDQESLSPSLKQVVSSLAEGQSSEPIETDGGWAVIKVNKITPGKTKTFETAKEQVIQLLKKQLADDALYNLRNKIEDDLANGLSLKEIAKQNQLHLISLSSVDANGFDPKGHSLVTPEQREALQKAFELSAGSVGSLEEFKDRDGFYVASVGQITPASVPSFEEIRKEIETFYVIEKGVEATMKKASSYASTIKSTNDLLKVAQNQKWPTQKIGPVNQESLTASKLKGIPVSLWESLLVLPEGKVIFAPIKEGNQYSIAMVMLDKNQAPSSKEKEAFSQKLDTLYTQDAQELFIKHLKEGKSISIDQQALDSLASKD